MQFLSAILIEPVSSVLKNEKNIIFIPSGPLFNFPLGILEMSSEPLMLIHTVSQVPSLAVWYELLKNRQTLEKDPESKASVAVFCNSNKIVDDLKCVRAEALAIAPGYSVSPIVTDKISSKRFREAGRGRDILHYCSHRKFDRDAPLLPNLQLLPKDAPENIRALDVANMISPAKLVVLSACFSGFGKILGSNDGYGFPHALLAIGVKAFVGSLWKANDSASLIFMFIFYREIQSLRADKKVTIAQAFATAQRQLRNLSRASYYTCIDQIILELKKCDPRTSKRIVNMAEQIWLLEWSKNNEDPARFADPFFWAAFVLTGDGSQILSPSAKATSLPTEASGMNGSGNQGPARSNPPHVRLGLEDGIVQALRD